VPGSPHGEEVTRRRERHQGRKQQEACNVEDHGYAACAAGKSYDNRPNLAFIGEQSGNGSAYHQTLAMRQARTRIASASAAQTTSVGELLRPPTGVDTGFAAAGAAKGIRIAYATDFKQKQKRPRIDRGL
jgi:hypothetical protein